MTLTFNLAPCRSADFSFESRAASTRLHVIMINWNRGFKNCVRQCDATRSDLMDNGGECGEKMRSEAVATECELRELLSLPFLLLQLIRQSCQERLHIFVLHLDDGRIPGLLLDAEAAVAAVNVLRQSRPSLLLCLL